MTFEDYYRTLNIEKSHTADEEAEARTAWGLGEDLAIYGMSPRDVWLRARAEADKRNPSNRLMWVKAFCRGHAEAMAGRS